jgi:polyhydroxybutyrate depolymerase
LRRRNARRVGGSEAGKLLPGGITSGGLQRGFYLFVPSGYDPAESLPLVLALHGHFGDGPKMEGLSHLSSIAEDAGFIVAYPDGMNRGWNDGRPDVNQGVDDVTFIRDLLTTLQSRYNIDSQRIYATGMSNGGFMSYRLACEMAGQFAAIAPVAATMGKGLSSGCSPAHPISVCLIHGTADPLVPWNGGPVGRGLRQRGDVLSGDETARYWAKVNSCETTSSNREVAPSDPADPTRIFVTWYKNGRAGSEVILYRIEGGGHAWPGGIQYLPARWVGTASRQMDASRVIWDFFSRHRREA